MKRFFNALYAVWMIVYSSVCFFKMTNGTPDLKWLILFVPSIFVAAWLITNLFEEQK